MTPQNVSLLLKKGFSEVLVEHDAGAQAQFLNEDYEKAGATLVSREDILKTSDILLKVRPPLLGKEAEYVRDGSTLISFIYPRQNKEIVEALSQRGVNALAMDMIPRISRAQTFDALRYALSSYHSLKVDAQRGDIVVQWPTLLGTRPYWKLLITSVDI